MKKVLIDMHRLKHNAYNGLYTFSYNLGIAISKIKDPELEFYFYLPKDKFGIFGNDVKYVEHKSFDKFFMLNTSKFDVWNVTTHLSWYKPFNKKTKVVYTIHDLNFLIEDEQNISRNKRLLKLIQQRVNRSNFIVGISQYALDVCKRNLQLGNKPQAVIYNGCNKPNTDDLILPNYKPNTPFLFALGLIERRKNFHLLPSLLKNNNYQLIIAGKQEDVYTQKIKHEIIKCGVEDRVILTGPISENDKYWYYKNCEAFLFPSYAEGFGLPIIEAMQFGKPVFTSTKTCLPEIGGNAAYYFDNFEGGEMQKKLAEGILDYKKNLPIEKIKQRAAFFNWDDAAKAYIEIYKKL